MKNKGKLLFTLDYTSDDEEPKCNICQNVDQSNEFCNECGPNGGWRHYRRTVRIYENADVSPIGSRRHSGIFEEVIDSNPVDKDDKRIIPLMNVDRVNNSSFNEETFNREYDTQWDKPVEGQALTPKEIEKYQKMVDEVVIKTTNENEMRNYISEEEKR